MFMHTCYDAIMQLIHITATISITNLCITRFWGMLFHAGEALHGGLT